MTHEEALADLKARVGAFMDDAKIKALWGIDRLQASGVDIIGDHIRLTKEKGPFLVPRDFIAAFAEEMKCQQGAYTKDPRDRARNKRIKNYERMM